MLFVFQICASLKPVILFPGTYASGLVYSGSNSDLEWYCPTKLDQTFVWINDKYLVPPLINCLFEWVQLHYDNKTNTQVSIPGMDIDVYDFGHVDGVTYVDQFTENFSFIPYFSKLVRTFHKNLYEDDVTLFGAPHDWRFGIANQEVLWPRLKNLIETVTASTGQKAILLGHSFGGFVVHHFVSSIAPERYGTGWLDQYVDRAIEICPSFGGAGVAVQYAYQRKLTYSIEIKFDSLANTIEGSGAVHTHFPNYKLQQLHGNPPVIIDPDGKEYKASEVPQFLIDHGKVTGENINLLHIMEPFLSNAPKASKVKEFIFYNGALDTPNGIQIGDWEDVDSVTRLLGKGDGTVLSANLEAYCNNIADSSLTQCIDFNDPNDNTGSHYFLLFDESKLDEIYKATSDNEE